MVWLLARAAPSVDPSVDEPVDQPVDQPGDRSVDGSPLSTTCVSRRPAATTAGWDRHRDWNQSRCAEVEVDAAVPVVGAGDGADEQRDPEVEQAERDHRAGRRGCGHAVGDQQRAERRVGHADAAGERTDERGHDRERVDQQRRRQAEVDAEPGEHHESAAQPSSLPNTAVPSSAVVARQSARRRAIAHASSCPAQPSTSRAGRPKRVRRPRSQLSGATGDGHDQRPAARHQHERRRRRRARTPRSRSHRRARRRAGCRSRRRRSMRPRRAGTARWSRRPCPRGTPRSCGRGRSPTRSAWARYGTSPAAPADFTTLLVAYDIALSFTIGASGASSSTSRNEARACSPRLSTPSATSARPDRQRGGPRETTLPRAGRKSSAWETTNQPTNTARTAPRIRGVQPVRRFTAGASSGVPENLMWTVSPSGGVTRASGPGFGVNAGLRGLRWS